MGLQNKIFIYAGVSLLALMTLLTWISLQTNSQATGMVHQERLALVKNIASSIDDTIDDLTTEVYNSAFVIGQGWRGNLTESDKTQLTTLRTHLGQYLEFPQSDSSVLVALLDADGKILWTEPIGDQIIGQSLAGIYSVRNVMNTGALFAGTGEPLFTQANPVFSVVVPVKDQQGMFIGMLAADIPTLADNSVFSALLQHEVSGYNMELITEDNGLILASSSPNSPAVYSPEWASISTLAQSRSPGIVVYSPPGGDERLVAFAPLSIVPWGLVLERPDEMALALPWMGGRPLLVTGLVLLLAAGLMWMVRRQIVSPLQKLAATARRFGSGDLEETIPVMGCDEIGNLAQSLDTMRKQLKHSLDEIGQWNRELEQRVKQRTGELEHLGQQLREQNKERSALLRKIITTQEEERQRIARELHDEVGQSITSLMIGFRLLDNQDPEKMRIGIAELKRLSANTLDEVRHLAVELRPSSIDDLGLIAALQQYTRDYTEKFGVSADFQASGFEGKRVQPEVEIALYRIIQEALTNVAKHAEAKKVSVLMGIRNSSIVAIVEDNGKGFDAQSVLSSKTIEKKLGLYGMQERASLIGGVLTIESAPGQGTTIFVEVPLKGD